MKIRQKIRRITAKAKLRLRDRRERELRQLTLRANKAEKQARIAEAKARQRERIAQAKGRVVKVKPKGSSVSKVISGFQKFAHNIAEADRRIGERQRKRCK